jgi:hypothetical protein
MEFEQHLAALVHNSSKILDDAATKVPICDTVYVRFFTTLRCRFSLIWPLPALCDSGAVEANKVLSRVARVRPPWLNSTTHIAADHGCFFEASYIHHVPFDLLCLHLPSSTNHHIVSLKFFPSSALWVSLQIMLLCVS